MIRKPLTIPIPIFQEQALLRRIPHSHEKTPIIKEDLVKRITGYKGEKKIAYYLSFLKKDQFDIFYSLRLINEYAFQMDVLLLSAKYLLILEVKNISGTLLFDRFSDQLIRLLHEKEHRFSNPIIQAKRQKHQLAYWIDSHKLPFIPIEYLVVNANSSTILKTNHYDKEILERVIHDELIIEKIEKLEAKFKRNIYEKKTIQKLSRLLLKNHQELTLNILDKFEIRKKEILPGVRCSCCGKLYMDRLYGKWVCLKCKNISKDAHREAIIDYLFLFTTITNQECRQFLKLSSRVTATNFLNSLPLTIVGTKKGTYYTLPEPSEINSLSFLNPLE